MERGRGPPLSDTNVAAGGTVSVGGVRSTTDTVKEASADAPKLSAAEVHVTGVVPSGNRLPDAGTHVTVSGPSTVSDAVGAGVYVTVDPLGPFASTTWLGGTTTVGGAFVTFTVTVNEPDDWLLRESTLVHESGACAVDLHQRITPRGFPCPLDYERLSQRLEPVELCGYTREQVDELRAAGVFGDVPAAAR